MTRFRLILAGLVLAAALGVALGVGHHQSTVGDTVSASELADGAVAARALHTQPARDLQTIPIGIPAGVGVLCFVYDDVLLGQTYAADDMGARGIVGTFGIPADWYGGYRHSPDPTPQYTRMTPAQVASHQIMRGFEVCAHAKFHGHTFDPAPNGQTTWPTGAVLDAELDGFGYSEAADPELATWRGADDATGVPLEAYLGYDPARGIDRYTAVYASLVSGPVKATHLPIRTFLTPGNWNTNSPEEGDFPHGHPSTLQILRRFPRGWVGGALFAPVDLSGTIFTTLPPPCSGGRMSLNGGVGVLDGDGEARLIHYVQTLAATGSAGYLMAHDICPEVGGGERQTATLSRTHLDAVLDEIRDLVAEGKLITLPLSGFLSAQRGTRQDLAVNGDFAVPNFGGTGACGWSHLIGAGGSFSWSADGGPNGAGALGDPYIQVGGIATAAFAQQAYLWTYANRFVTIEFDVCQIAGTHWSMKMMGGSPNTPIEMPIDTRTMASLYELGTWADNDTTDRTWYRVVLHKSLPYPFSYLAVRLCTNNAERVARFANFHLYPSG